MNTKNDKQVKAVNLDDLELIKKIDTEDMYHKIIHLPEQIKDAYDNHKLHVPEDFPTLLKQMEEKPVRRIIIVGMGGSAISGDILQAAFEDVVPIQVYKDYRIPIINDDDLFIACSYSGNTEETVSSLEQALQKTKYVAAVTSGGKVKSIIRDKYLWCELPQGYPPRSAVGYLFFSFLVLLEKLEIIPPQQEYVNKTVAALMIKAGAISTGIETKLNIAKQAAIAINGKTPLIYASYPGLSAVAYRWKCQINENSKYPAFTHAFPEMNHNEIEAWENKEYNPLYLPIFIGRLKEDKEYQKRITIFKKLMNREGVDYLEFFGEGNSFLEAAFSLIYLGDVISFYLAILQEVNPTTINFINHLKEELDKAD